MPRTRHRRLATGLALTIALAGAAACSDDDDDTSSESPEVTAAVVSDEACDAFIALSGALAGDPSGIGAIAADFTSSAPANLTEAATTMADAYSSLAAGGASTVFGEPAYVAAAADISDAYFAGCDVDEELDVDGVDYGFDGLPAEVAAGRVAVRFTNKTEHDEAHELVLFKRNPGTDEPVEELLALPEEESMAKVTMAGVVFADSPEQEAVAMLDLEPGEYVAVCFLPVGGGEEGPPHFVQGMVAEFEAS